MMTVFDAPDALGGIPGRPSTTVAPQALYMMNDPEVRQYAKALAQRIANRRGLSPFVESAEQKGTVPFSPAGGSQLSPKPDIELKAAILMAYLTTLGREPTAEETADSLEFVNQQTASYRQAGDKNARELGLTDFCQAMLCLNEFIYVE